MVGFEQYRTFVPGSPTGRGSKGGQLFMFVGLSHVPHGSFQVNVEGFVEGGVVFMQPMRRKNRERRRMWVGVFKVGLRSINIIPKKDPSSLILNSYCFVTNIPYSLRQ